jgi:hypothetical protein
LWLLIYDIEAGFSLWYQVHLSHSLPNLRLRTNSPKAPKEKSQTQADEEYGKHEDENRRDAAAFISSDRGPCCTT